MAQVSPGDRIFVPVSVEKGAFPRESLITFDTKEGPVSGFIRSEQIVQRKGASFVQAEVLKVAQDAIAVRFDGSFFTTTGLAYISPQSDFLTAA